MSDIQCKDCITYAICRSQILPYLNGDGREAVIGLLQTLDRKCLTLAAYIKETRESENQPLIPHISKCLNLIFKE